MEDIDCCGLGCKRVGGQLRHVGVEALIVSEEFADVKKLRVAGMRLCH